MPRRRPVAIRRRKGTRRRGGNRIRLAIRRGRNGEWLGRGQQRLKISSLDVWQVCSNHDNGLGISVDGEAASHTARQILAPIVDNDGAQLAGGDVRHRIRRDNRDRQPSALAGVDDARQQPQRERVTLLGIEHIAKTRLGVIERLERYQGYHPAAVYVRTARATRREFRDPDRVQGLE